MRHGKNSGATNGSVGSVPTATLGAVARVVSRDRGSARPTKALSPWAAERFQSDGADKGVEEEEDDDEEDDAAPDGGMLTTSANDDMELDG